MSIFVYRNYVQSLPVVTNCSCFSSRILEREPTVTLEVEWSRPTEAYGELHGYRLRYGVRDQDLQEEILEGTQVQHFKIEDLGTYNLIFFSMIFPLLCVTRRNV